MPMLLAGMLLFACVHFIPSLAPGFRARCFERMGEGGYKGLFSLLLLGSFALIIFGWRSAQPSTVYLPLAALHSLALGLLALAFLLLALSQRQSRLRQVVRHPQLTGVALWGIAHLLLNGDTRSVILFGGMAVWAVLEILAINRREGVWIKEAVPGWATEVVSVVIAAVTIGIVIAIHPWLSGKAVF